MGYVFAMDWYVVACFSWKGDRGGVGGDSFDVEIGLAIGKREGEGRDSEASDRVVLSGGGSEGRVFVLGIIGVG